MPTDPTASRPEPVKWPEYRKTATIRAVQFDPGNPPPCVRVEADGYFIDTLEGAHRVSPGDWIARGVKGEFWPIKPDVFAAIYVLARPAAGEAGLAERIVDEVARFDAYLATDMARREEAKKAVRALLSASRPADGAGKGAR